MAKVYKPGQIVSFSFLRIYASVPESKKHIVRFRLTKCKRAEKTRCANCDAIIGMNGIVCNRFCSRLHNDYEKNPNGYVLRFI